MCKANDRYWEKEIGKEIVCKCGRVHYKERRPKSKTCKYCLSSANEQRLIIDINKTRKQVFRLIGVWQCTECLVIKPNSEFFNCKKNNVQGRCKKCASRWKLDKWKNDKDYRERKLKRAKEYREENKDKIREWSRNYNKTRVSQVVRYKNGDRSFINIIQCADCGEVETNRYMGFVKCICAKCWKLRDARNRYYIHALNNNGLINSIKRMCTFHSCNNVLLVGYGDKYPYCSGCESKAEARAKRLSNAAKKRRRRGGRVRGVSYDPYDVFSRDKWRCYLCNVKTQKKDIYADNAAEIDHVIPLSKGGKDIPSNVKCCCRSCNNSKSDKIIPVVGNLFCQIDAHEA